MAESEPNATTHSAPAVSKETVVLLAKRETPDTILLRLETPSAFKFTPGQFIMIGVVPDLISGKEVKRSYSIASAPHPGHVEILIKRQEPGLVSVFVQDLKEGARMNLYGPFGRHFIFDIARYQLLAETERPHIVFLAGGSGIAPFRGMLQAAVHAEYKGTITVLFSVRTGADIIAYEDLKHLTAKLPNARIVITLTRPNDDDLRSWKGPFGRITKKLILDTLGSEISTSTHEFWVCGPGALVVDARRVLEELGIPSTAVKAENYGAIDG